DVDDDYLELIQTKISQSNTWLKKLRFWQILKCNSIYYHRILTRASRLILVKDQKIKYPQSILPNLPFQILLKDEPRKFFPSSGRSLLFVGKLSYPPNSEGISWFLNQVWPETVK